MQNLMGWHLRRVCDCTQEGGGASGALALHVAGTSAVLVGPREVGACPGQLFVGP